MQKIPFESSYVNLYEKLHFFPVAISFQEVVGGDLEAAAVSLRGSAWPLFAFNTCGLLCYFFMCFIG